MECQYYRENLCHSCATIELPYEQQVAAKENDAHTLLQAYPHVKWLPTATSAQSGFRNKAKFVVGGTADHPTLGTVDYRSGASTDLGQCPLYIEQIEPAVPVLREFIRRAHLTPYDIPKRRGELKNILVTASDDGQLMIRFVLRSKKLLVPIKKNMDWLCQQLPTARVISVNLLREHVALVEGDEEIILTDHQTLPMRVNDMVLHLRPQSFFQTNTSIAEAMYSQAQQWVAEVQPGSLWDLYCGVGGFALHAAEVMEPHAPVTGIEISSEAIASARWTARESSIENLHFSAQDAPEFALSSGSVPEVLIMNPPRRGIGAKLCSWVQDSGIERVIYSSCNAKTLAQDLERMPAYDPVQARVLDMFPNSNHYEVITLLQRRA
ncbi:MAG: 23S rRNA (uracil(747)-C(5))-methyltransferase RlmC [Rothia sp. (in: high G+C Gram-positive bacteria)]|uniref:23S rRNA (uracil(747)-C(5))-methyltransferase RlmC n=1 Tax=Rothia sp. (in: high G+C Gram-positive bacteria) TaxID=1885016 RepID=UPI0026E03385|nr:23S rRNA (uracil(747)-C(5))-methyltransferase RlmC [Rothia sp. (in: high G+C Gram-positive bacteria)]MDO5749813.1 23S rRNA (uracil(747)-C(5))-methyltransferase RlmC [Rothia sp. (in: high G+C Gram-positive bacteria)]